VPGQGFSSPSILFLSTWDAPERAFCRQVFGSLRERGYTRYVEPCAGAFAMPIVARAAGWQPEQMECSDVNLFSSIVGATLSSGAPLGLSFEELGVSVNGEPAVIPDGRPAERGAYLLWLQLLARMEARPDAEYWRALTADLLDRAGEHQAAIALKLEGLYTRIAGLSFRTEDCWEHIKAVADDPHTVISMNPPSYASGFERFFDTGGRLTWNEPHYAVWTPDVDLYKLSEFMEGKAALLVLQQQRQPGKASHKRPVFARHLAQDAYVYIVSNRPDEIFAITGGPRVMPRKPGEIMPGDFPPIDVKHVVTPKSRVELVPVKANVADYYRQLWMHRLVAAPGSYNMLVVVDGKAAGVLGYSTDSIVRPYSMDSRWNRHLLMRFAFGAPHDELRLTRLATMLALQRKTAERALGPAAAVYYAASDGVITVEYTQRDESKGLRGLMKPSCPPGCPHPKGAKGCGKQPHPDGWKLTYVADWQDKTPEAVLAEYLQKEARWRAASKKAGQGG
jgi:hypothetical protein